MKTSDENFYILGKGIEKLLESFQKFDISLMTIKFNRQILKNHCVKISHFHVTIFFSKLNFFFFLNFRHLVKIVSEI